MERICPHCSTEMPVEDVYGVMLDVCPRCAGIWFDSEELRKLLVQDPQILIELEDLSVMKIEQEFAGSSLRRCPACNMPLQEYNYQYDSPVVLDICPDCGGFFVEDGELAKMQEWREQSHRPLTKEEEDRLLLAQAAIGHDAEMNRQRNLLHFFNVLRRFQPGWIGLLP